MNAIDYISYMAANSLLDKHTAETAYVKYKNENETDLSSQGFFRAKFNAKKRSLGLPLDIIVQTPSMITEEQDEKLKDNGIELLEEVTIEASDNEPTVEEGIKEEAEDSLNTTAIQNEIENTAIKEEIEVEVDKFTQGQSEVEIEYGITDKFLDRLEPIKVTNEPINIEVTAEETCETAKDVFSQLEDKANENRVEVFEGMASKVISNHDIPEVPEVKTTEVEVYLDENNKPKLRGLEIINYNDGHELPELPGLIPTGTLFDKVVCDRFMTDEQKEKYPPEAWERGGFTRKCCDVTAGGAGEI